MKKTLLTMATLAVLAAGAQGQVLLTAGTYTQNFDGLGNSSGATSLPSGWSLRNDATSSSLGTAITSISRNTWADTAGGGRNVASTSGLNSGSDTTAQNSSTNRALGYRQSGSAGDPGAAFVFNFNSTDLNVTSISFDFLTLDVEPRSTTWLAQVSSDGSAWTTLTTSPATITDAGSWGSVAISISSIPAGVSDASSAYFRLFASVASSGSGSRDTIAIDNFSLTATAVPEPTAGMLLGGAGFMLWVLRRKRVSVMS